MFGLGMGLGLSRRQIISEKSIILTSDQTTLKQHSWLLQLPFGKKIKIDWGDGNVDIVEGEGTSDITVAHDYTVQGIYKIKITGDLSSITKLRIMYENNLFGHLEVRLLTSLKILILSNVLITINACEISQLILLEWLTLINVPNVTINGGEIRSLISLNTYLYLINIGDLTINGNEIGSLIFLQHLKISSTESYSTHNVTIGENEISNLTQLTELYISNAEGQEVNGRITIDQYETFPSNIDITLQNCGLGKIEGDKSVDYTLIRVNAANPGIWYYSVTINGTNNGYRTSLSDNAVRDLEDRGWTVTVNEPSE